MLAGGAGLVWMAAAGAVFRPSSLLLTLEPAALPADGVSRATLTLREVHGRRLRAGARGVAVSVVSGNRSARVVSLSEDAGAITAVIEAGVMPGTVELEAQAPGTAPVRAQLTMRLDLSDRAGNGTPDFLRLDSPADRDAFRRWFTFLAEALAFAQPQELPREVVDCAALVRFAYREALRTHDAAWAEPLRLPALPAIPAIEKYAYPFTPLGAGLFRVRPGTFAASDLQDGTFAEFADAQTLSRRNAHFVTRNVGHARPGDLLFYRPYGHHDPETDTYHTMVFLGPSQFEPGAETWVVYHTGPSSAGGHAAAADYAAASRVGPGEIRRVTLGDLLRHPDPRWHPVPANPYFLGVYRWNILRGAE